MAENFREGSLGELDARAREVQFLLDGGMIAEAINLFIGERLNVRLFEASRHDLGIPLGERVLALVNKHLIPRPTADYFSGYLPDHYACAGRIRSAVNLMKTIPIDDRWTALCDQIWILLRAGEYRAAREIFAKAPDWRRQSSYEWVLAQLTYYEWNETCLLHFRNTLDQSQNLLPSYKFRLNTQFANALLDFHQIEQAQKILVDIPPLKTDQQNPFPSEQIHADLVRAKIAESEGKASEALAILNTALLISQAIGDDHGVLCSLLCRARLQLGIPPFFESVGVSFAFNLQDDLRNIMNILRATGEGDRDYGFPIEGLQLHLIIAARAAMAKDPANLQYHLDKAEELHRVCEHSRSRTCIDNFKQMIAL